MQNSSDIIRPSLLQSEVSEDLTYTKQLQKLMASLETLLANLKATFDQAQQPSNLMQGPVIKLEAQQVDG
jgi:hypothetical protein